MANAGKSCASCGGHYGSEVLFCPLDGTPLSSSRTLAASPHEIDPYLFLELPGQIQLNALVGIGSMGRVYRAFQQGVERDVAVKILHRELTGNLELVARFHREAKIASRLVHPNVVQVLMTGSLPASSNARVGGEVYLVMEYLDGISLLSALAAQGEGGALPLARTLHIILQLCDSVGEAHVNNIVHRDLKPENIMLVRRGEDPDFVKVLDFGIARLDSAIEGSTTQAGLIFGTAKYISPEGAEGKHVGPQADVYAIATVLYQCLAGRTPFLGDSPMALLVQQIHGTPTDLRSVPRAAYVPEPIARVVMGNLSKDPQDRSENARAFGRELALAARDAGLHLDTMHGGAPRGDLRLLSKQRTRQHEFSAELKAKIAAMPNGYGGRDGRAALGVSASSVDGVALARESGASLRPITTFEDASDLPRRPVPPAPTPPSPESAYHGGVRPTEIGERSSRPGMTQMGDERSSAPGQTQLPDDAWDPPQVQRADDDATINGTLDSASLPQGVDGVVVGKTHGTIPGSPLENGVGTLSASPTPTEDLVEGPISSQPPHVPRPSTAGPSRPGHSRPGLSQPDLSPRPSQPGAPSPAGSRPAGSRPGASSPGLSAVSPRVSSPGPSPRPNLGSSPSLPNGAPSNGAATARGSLPDTDTVADVTSSPVGPPRKSPADPTLMEPVVKSPRGLSSEPERDDVAPARPVTWKTFALIASLLIIVPVGALAAARLLNDDRPDEAQTFEATLVSAEQAVDRRAWDSPAGANVKELTDKLLAESPGDRRVLGLRQAAAEAIVNDGLTKKFAGDRAEALRLFRLAVELSPDLETARTLVRDLEAPPKVASSAPTSTAPVASASASAAVSARPIPSAIAKIPTARPPGSAKPTGTSTVAPKPTATDDGVLVPPEVNPQPTGTNTGPWM